MEESLLKTNFIGRDGFVWWIGQIATEKSWEKQASGEGWGLRYKVRIMGYHPDSEAELKDDDLPWAQVMVTSGTGSANVFKTVRYNQGDVVVGFFLDGDNAQLPVIMGAFGNSKYAPKDEPAGPFRSFSGYSDTMKKPSKAALKATETGDQSNASQESPRNLPPAKAAKSKPDNPATYTNSDGKVISLACGNDEEANKGNKSVISKIKNAIQGFVEDLQNFRASIDLNIEYARKWIKDEIDTRAEQITQLASGLISGMVSGIFTKLAPVLGQGLNLLYIDVFGKLLAATGNPIIAHAGGVAAQTATLPGVKVLSDLIGCLTNLVMSKVTGLIADILKSVADNILNFADCIADQTVGAMINGIISLLTDGILPALEGISKILQFFENFNFADFARNSLDALLGLIGLGSCFKKKTKDKYGACKYRLGCGPVKGSDVNLDKLLSISNEANAVSVAAQAAGLPLDGVQNIVGSFNFFSDAISDPASQVIGDPESCFGGFPTICSPPKINIFGGGGEGAEGIPIFGALVGDSGNKTGSVIDIKITNPGSGYTFPPFVEVVDNCNQGYGCVARATIRDGQVDRIYVVSEGENYPATESDPYVVTSVNIINPGYGYEDGDMVVDNLGNEYDVQIQSGSIIKVTPINRKDITDMPVLKVLTSTGTDALLYANLGDRIDDGEVKRVVDCVT